MSRVSLSVACQRDELMPYIVTVCQGKHEDIVPSWTWAPSRFTARFMRSWHCVVQRSILPFIVTLHICSPVFTDHSRSRSICREISGANKNDRIPFLLSVWLRIPPAWPRGKTDTSLIINWLFGWKQRKMSAYATHFFKQIGRRKAIFLVYSSTPDWNMVITSDMDLHFLFCSKSFNSLGNNIYHFVKEFIFPLHFYILACSMINFFVFWGFCSIDNAKCHTTGKLNMNSSIVLQIKISKMCFYILNWWYIELHFP